MTRWLAPVITLSMAALFWVSVALQDDATQQHEIPEEVVVAEPVQVLLYAGDRFLAANIEAIRAQAAATVGDAHSFRLRAHAAASRLNPCHEDNYWIGNSSLSWGGATEQGFQLLRNASRCRFWDEWPVFFYGFNQSFFLHKIPEARRAMEIAAQRSTDNAAMFRNFSIMLAAGEIDDTQMALELLENERDQAKDPKLHEMLDKRVIRLKGLITLRNAQAAFEKRYKRPLKQPGELLDSGLLDGFPDDPLRIGYEFRDQNFHLRQMKIQQ